MNCRKIRDRLVAGPSSDMIERHLAECDGGRTFAVDLGAVRESLRRHHAGVTPDPSFAARVGSSLRAVQPVELLGWAAMKLLPLSLVVALVLAWWAWDHTTTTVGPAPQAAVEDSDPLAWLFDESAGAR